MNRSGLRRALLFGGIVTTALASLGSDCGVTATPAACPSGICKEPADPDYVFCGCQSDMSVADSGQPTDAKR